MGCACTKPQKQPKSPALDALDSQNYSPRSIGLGSPRSPLQIVPAVPHQSRIIIKSMFTARDIEAADYTPQSTNRHILKYSCPICLKYLNSILVTTCCRNYLCRFCAEDLKMKETDLQRCPMCNADPVVLVDVDPGEPVKRYSDSPYSTFGAGKSSNGGSKWVSKLEIVQEDMKLAKELEEKSERSDLEIKETVQPRVWNLSVTS